MFSCYDLSYPTFLLTQDRVIVLTGARRAAASGDARSIDDRESAGSLHRFPGRRIDHFAPERSRGELPVVENIGNGGDWIAEHLFSQRGVKKLLLGHRRQKSADRRFESVDLFLRQRRHL